MVQLTNNIDTNWNIYLDDNNKTVWSIAIKSSCQDSYFGDMRHVIACIYNYASFKKSDFTPEGLKILESHVKQLNSTLDYLFNNAGQKLANVRIV